MEQNGMEDLPLYPESRPCRRPTARKLIDLFEDVQRHTLTSPAGPPVVFTTELTRLQRTVLRPPGDVRRLRLVSRKGVEEIPRYRTRDVRKVG